MASKADRFYYENFSAAAQCSCDAAEYLRKCLNHYNKSALKEMLQMMHELENAGDSKRHEMNEALAKAFVTPLDREDLAEISSSIDNVTDAIEEVLQRFYIDQIEEVVPQAKEFAAIIVRCCEAMKRVLDELPNFKKPKRLHELVIEVSHLEEECDKMYLQAAMELRNVSTDIMLVFAWRGIIDRMEKCADACEHVADSIEKLVMKNS